MLRRLTLMWEAVIVRPFIRGKRGRFYKRKEIRYQYRVDYSFNGDEWESFISYVGLRNVEVTKLRTCLEHRTIEEAFKAASDNVGRVIGAHLNQKDLRNAGPGICRNCSYYSGDIYLRCAVRPSGPTSSTECPDYRSR